MYYHLFGIVTVLEYNSGTKIVLSLTGIRWIENRLLHTCRFKLCCCDIGLSCSMSVYISLYKLDQMSNFPDKWKVNKHYQRTEVHVLKHSLFLSRQQDAQEFLRYLLEGLHEDVNRVTQKPKHQQIEDEKFTRSVEPLFSNFL